MFDIISIGKKFSHHAPIFERQAVSIEGFNSSDLDSVVNVISQEAVEDTSVTDLLVTEDEPSKVVLYNRLTKKEVRKIDLKSKVLKLLTVSNSNLSNQFVAVCEQGETSLVLYIVKYSDKNARKYELETMHVMTKDGDGNQVKLNAIDAMFNTPWFTEKSKDTRGLPMHHICVKSRWENFAGSEDQLSTVSKVITCVSYFQDRQAMFNDKGIIVLRQMTPSFRNSSAVGSPGLIEVTPVCPEYPIGVYLTEDLVLNKFESYRGVVAGLFNASKIIFLNRKANIADSSQGKGPLISFSGSDITSFCFNASKLFTVVANKQVYCYNSFGALYDSSAVRADVRQAGVESNEKAKALFPEIGWLEPRFKLSQAVDVALPFADTVIDLENEQDRIYGIKCFNHGDHELVVFMVESPISTSKCMYMLYGIRNNQVIFKHKFVDLIRDVKYNVTKVEQITVNRSSQSGSVNANTRTRVRIEEMVTVKLSSGSDVLFRLELTNNASNSTVVRDMNSERVATRSDTHAQIARFLDI